MDITKAHQQEKHIISLPSSSTAIPCNELSATPFVFFLQNYLKSTHCLFGSELLVLPLYFSAQHWENAPEGALILGPSSLLCHTGERCIARAIVSYCAMLKRGSLMGELVMVRGLPPWYDVAVGSV